MNARLIDALQDCLERVEDGQPLEVALAHYADLAAELYPLLVAARTIRRQRPVPAPAFRARVQVALSNAVRDTGPMPADRRPLWRVLAVRLGGLGLAAALAAGGVVAASANSRPGDLLYPVRRGVEQLRSAAAEALAPVVQTVRALQAPAGAPAAATPVVAAGSDRRSAGSAGATAGNRAQPRGGRPAAPPQPEAGERRSLGRVTGGRESRGSGPADASMGDQAGAPFGAGAPATVAVAAAPTATSSPVSAGHAVPTLAGRTDVRHATATGAPATPTVAAGAGEPTAAPAGVPLVPAATGTPRSGDGRSSLAGTVLREDGSPLGRAQVSVYPLGAANEILWWRRRETRVGEDGRYRFGGLAPGRYKVRASYGVYYPVSRWYPAASKSSDAEAITLAPGETREALDIRFEHLPPWLSPWPWRNPWGRGR